MKKNVESAKNKWKNQEQIKFEIADPRERDVICTHDCWNSHIIVNHPEMTRAEREIKKAISDPFMIAQSAKEKQREVYYRRRTRGKRYTRVIVDFNNPTQGFVCSAHRSDGGREKETIIWLRSND